MHGGIDPELLGPFETDVIRLDKAIEIRRDPEQDAADDIFVALDAVGVTDVNAYSGGAMEGRFSYENPVEEGSEREQD